MKPKRPYRVISGPAYPGLQDPASQTREITANLDDPMEYYHDESIKLSDDQVKEFIGKPICVEHHPDLEVGEISNAWKGADGNMWMSARIYTDNGAQDVVNREIDGGRLNELSVGYDTEFKNGQVVRKHINEISLCKKAFFQGARVAVAANDLQSEKRGYKNSGSIMFKIRAMSGENSAATQPLAQQPAAVNTPSDSQIAKDQIELARAHDELLKEKEEAQRIRDEMAKRIQELEAKDKAHAEEKARELDRFREDMKPKLEEVLGLKEQIYKEEHGAEAAFPEDAKAAISNAFMEPSAGMVRQEITASTNAWKRNRDARIKAEEELKRLQDSNNVELARINASREKIQQGTSLTPTSGSEQAPYHSSAADDTDSRRIAAHQVKMGQLFCPAPSDMEKEIYARDYSNSLGAQSYGMVGVNASNNNSNNAGPQIPQARQHPLVNQLRNSARKHYPRQFDYYVSCNASSVFSHPMKHEYNIDELA